MTDIDTAFYQAVAVYEKQLVTRIQFDLQRDLFFNRQSTPRAFALGRAPDWTTRLCERVEERDDGLERAYAIERQKLADTLITIAEEWGVAELLHDEDCY